VNSTRVELIAALLTANATAKRVRGTVYHERAHRYINVLLDQLDQLTAR
jgi:hypothetical protein